MFRRHHHRKRIFRRYEGSGILFVAGGAEHPSDMLVLLASRRRSGIWTIPGGGREPGDADCWATALREVTEEFGPLPRSAAKLGRQRYPFGLLGFEWTTHVVRLSAPTEAGVFPAEGARDFPHEFREAKWFPLKAMPPRTHLLLIPVLWKLRMGWLQQSTGAAPE